ncbi:MAG TPA: DUF5309 family protein [Dissulfurispiraceae bacterium]|nr:DUF5309 family protein [Dissulfurispiraceae bacterium]
MFAGMRGTASWGADERPKNFREYILWANPNGSAPLTALLARARSEKVDDPEFNWWQERLQAVRVVINFTTGYVSTDNTLTISSGGLQLVPGDVLMVEGTEAATYSNELMLVSSVTSNTVIVVKRGIAGSTAAAISNGFGITKVGSAHAEGTTAPAIALRNPTKQTNYTQIFKTSVGLTRTASQTYARTGEAWKNDKKRKAFDHSVDIEMAFLFGRPSEDTSGTYPQRYTGGLRFFITTNSTVFTTTPTEDTFMNAIFKVFDYNKNSGAGDQRVILAGNGFLNSLNRLAKNSSSTRINFDGTIKIMGMELQKWVLPQGTFAVRTHPLLNLHSRYTNSAFVLDFSNLVYRPLQDTIFTDNVQLKKEDRREGLWLTECGLEVQHEYTMAYLGNFVV